MPDTIAAISTPLGEGAIGIVRVSGPGARGILTAIFKPRREGDLLPYHLRLGWVIDPERGTQVDEVLATWMPEGGSYTGEETAEINCHGGITALRTVLRLVLRQGARLAGPGEFTLRAFLNGRLSLTEAESVIDIIRARNEAGLEGALRQLGGGLTRVAEGLYRRLCVMIARLEASLDFPDDVTPVDECRLREELLDVGAVLEQALSGAEQGRVLREGLRVVLVGRPNAGKSSLLNALLGQERAIVTPLPGTTRDVLEEETAWQGLPVRLFDTAGLGAVRDQAEASAVERAKREAAQADVVVLVVDSRDENNNGPEAGMAAAMDKERTVVALNKGDLCDRERLERLRVAYAGWPVVVTSAKEGWGLESLQEQVIGVVAARGIRPGASALVTRERQRRLLERCLSAVRETVEGLAARVPPDCLSVSLTGAGEALGELLGYNVREEVLGEIFAEFCIGK